MKIYRHMYKIHKICKRNEHAARLTVDCLIRIALGWLIDQLHMSGPEEVREPIYWLTIAHLTCLTWALRAALRLSNQSINQSIDHSGASRLKQSNNRTTKMEKLTLNKWRYKNINKWRYENSNYKKNYIHICIKRKYKNT